MRAAGLSSGIRSGTLLGRRSANVGAECVSALTVARRAQFTWPGQRQEYPKLGLNESVKLPFEKEFELYSNACSTCSVQVRMCLHECGVDFKSHHVDLITTGFWGNLEEDFAWINPKKTVPVLLYRGHPVYESHEQMKFIIDKTQNYTLMNTYDVVCDSAEDGGDNDSTNQMMITMNEDKQRELEEILVRFKPVKGELDGSNFDESMYASYKFLMAPMVISSINQASFYQVASSLIYHWDKQTALFCTLIKMFNYGGYLGRLMLLRIPLFYKLRSLGRIATKKHLDYFAQCIEKNGGPYLCGQLFTIADIYLTSLLFQLKISGHMDLIEKHNETIRKYFELMQSRDSYVRGCEDWRYYHSEGMPKVTEEFSQWCTDPTFLKYVRC